MPSYAQAAPNATMSKRIEIDDQVLKRIETKCPTYLTATGFINLLLDRALDASVTAPYDPGKGGRGDGAFGLEATAIETAYERLSSSSSIEEEKDILSKRRAPKQVVSGDARKRFVFSVPDDLADYKTDLLAYWREDKGGKKSEAAARTLINGCRAIREKYGDKVLRDQLELARGYGWENITLRNYEAHGLPRARNGAPIQPETRHPAAREFRNGRFVDDEPAANGVLAGLF